MQKVFRLSLFVFLFISFSSHASDTLRISIRQADSLFLRTNYQLLAAFMNIDVQQAQIIQARLYPNPIVTADVNLFDPENNKAFHVGRSGQKVFQIDQLILLGGKRRAQIDLAKTNAVIAELEFQETIRQLKFQLHTGLYALNQQRYLLDKYNAQLSLLDTILQAYESQAVRGNIPLRDVVRLKGVYLNLNNDRAELLQFYLDELSKVQTILQTNQVVIPIINEADLAAVIKDNTIDELTETALENRPDYRIAIQNTRAAEQYYLFQRRMAVPDVNLMTSYDQRGGAFNNQVNVGIAIPLPLWNRNQGNIRSARLTMQQYDYSQQGLRNQILIDVQNHLVLYNQTVSEYQKATRLYNDDFEITLKGMSDNFQKRNVTMIEFVDFFEAYNNALAEIVRIKIQLAVSAEQLNLIIGKELY